jgi:SAM-dependent methyltransferase
MLERLRSQAPELETVLADGTDPSQLPHDTDAVVALAVLIHHRHRDAARIITGLASMLRPGGRLLLDLALYEMSREPQHWTDLSVWTRAQLDTLAAELQLEVLHAPVSAGQFDGTTFGPQSGQILMLRRL